MSGVSLAVPHSSLSSDQTAPPPAPPAPATKQKQHHAAAAASASSNSMMGSLRVIELQLVAFILVFSASGLVPLLDLVFPALTSAYILALAKFAFPSHDTISKEEIFKGSRLFRMYVIAGTTIGLFLPLAYVLGGFARGDEHAVRSATPHLFLLSFQILTENIISSLSLFSPPVRALVPMIYTIRRIFVDIDWINDVWINKALPANAQVQDTAWYWFGKGLAVANMAYFCINLFGFLIPRFLPRAFERYFQERGEIYAKATEDKLSTPINKPQLSEKKRD
ncbi:hypothetical protein TanjilG_25975 [Lupinus angustifolius]|uniref:DUF7733 domain-containing protein n=1 Tax=Lupinus angustifolius TaxID=3871 RepID=A0A4P1QZ50_LUPAN|nr:PREDICTED: uncharacterized protein LOC109326754 [Lupinus angustifolius]XP_019415089.1 PREDICTED: uncharacterized protein LOC109326754 [Lupinus angustifolius]XP_019415091.1 PREDICTED: uncharacterized protein LOC109326754 [Lupinus angustifolius]OIV98110.1 hypothetical protein TanjilG_25975 [Lupinus angustifolius]